MTKPAVGAPRRHRRRKQRFTKKSVLKMLAVMSGNGNGEADPIQDFLSTGRVGRRNAMPNILSEHALTTTADLPEKLMCLTTDDGKEGESSQSRSMSTDDPKDCDGNEASGTSS